MSGAVHTPGPWAISSISQDTEAIGIAKDRILIAEVHNGYSFMDVVSGNYPTEQWANARLIAAAPELLEALQEVFEDQGKVHSLRWTDKVAAAIAKARGGAS